MRDNSKLQDAIDTAVDAAAEWFLRNSQVRTRKSFMGRGQLGPKSKSAVYLYSDGQDSALYVGQSKRSIKARLHDETSPHKKKEWWPKWTTVRFVQVPNETDRITLELLLILSFRPPYNTRPAARNVFDMFVISSGENVDDPSHGPSREGDGGGK